MNTHQTDYINWCHEHGKTQLLWDGIARYGDVTIRDGFVYKKKKCVGRHLRVERSGSVHFAISSKRDADASIREVERLRWHLLAHHQPRLLAIHHEVKEWLKRLLGPDQDSKIVVPTETGVIEYYIHKDYETEWLRWDDHNINDDETPLETFARVSSPHDEAADFHARACYSRAITDSFWRRVTRLTDLLYTLLANRCKPEHRWQQDLTIFTINGRNYPLLQHKAVSEFWPRPDTKLVTIPAGSIPVDEKPKTPTPKRRRKRRAFRAV